MKEGDYLFNKTDDRYNNPEITNNSNELYWDNDKAIKYSKKHNFHCLFITIFWPDGTIDYRYWSGYTKDSIYVLTKDELMIKDIIE